MNLIKNCRYGQMIINQNDTWVGASFENYGEFSEHEVLLFKSIIKNDMFVADVGANIGSHTIPFSQLVGKNGSVFAFEPERHNFYTLCGNVSVNNLRNVYCFQQAIGEGKKIVQVPEIQNFFKGNYGGFSLNNDYKNVECYPVQMTTIDSLNFCKLHFLKLDIEGMELQALNGSLETIKKQKPYLYFECDDANLKIKIFSLLNSLDYLIYEHLPSLFNKNNYYKKIENIFEGKTKDGLNVEIVSSNFFGHHKSQSCPVDIEEFKLKII